MFEGVSRAELIELIIRAVFEGLLILAAFWVLLVRFRLWEKLAPLGKWSARLFFGFLVVWTTVQMVDRWQYFYPQPVSFYPVVRFAMYQVGENGDTIQTYRFVGQFPDGSSSEINLTEHFRAIGLPSLHTRMRVLSERLHTTNATDAAAREEVHGFLIGVGALLEDLGQSSPEYVDLWIDTYRIHDQVLVDQQRIETFVIERET